MGQPSSRPDAIIITEGANPTIILIEFKYCKDTMPKDQILHSQDQHKELMKFIKQNLPTYNIKLIPILIGHSGTIYKKWTLDSMKEVGIDCQHAIKCASKMHLDAISQLHSIVKTRRHLEFHRPSPSTPRPLKTATTWANNKRHRSSDKPP
jgi:hypothetical protein